MREIEIEAVGEGQLWREGFELERENGMKEKKTKDERYILLPCCLYRIIINLIKQNSQTVTPKPQKNDCQIANRVFAVCVCNYQFLFSLG